MRVAQSAPIANALLAVLPRADYQRLLVNLEPVTLSFGEVLSEPGDSITHVYFPNNSLVSLLTVVDHHLALEVGMVGYEGMVGIGFALGVNVTAVRAMAQGAGTAMRMKVAPFRKALRQSPSLQREILLYAHALMAQIAQTAACNRFHFVEARLARWLLMTRDRVESDQFLLTHEFLGHMLGVRRVGVTKAAHALKQRKLIDYSRGSIAIIDGGGLEAASCSCYRRVQDRQSKKRKAGDRITSKPDVGS
jgi:CRP-like cAMP-binding protein